MATKRLKIENLQDLNIRDLTDEETASLQGGMLIAEEPIEGKGRGGRYNPYHPTFPKYPQPGPIQPIPCTNHPTKDGHLPWCAVIL